MREDLLTPNEITNLTETCQVLEEFDKAGEELSGEKYVTSFLVLPMLAFLRGSVKKNENDSIFKASLKKDLLDSINFYDEKYKMSKNELILACTYLNPRFKQMKCIKKDDREQCLTSVKKFLLETYESYAKDTNENMRRSDTISNLQKAPKKTKLVLEQYDSDNDDETSGEIEISELEEKVFFN